MNPFLEERQHCRWNDWRWQLQQSHSCGEKIIASLGLSAAARAVTTHYAMRVTPYYASLAQHWHASDPILRQCLPDAAELSDSAQASPDPLGEHQCEPLPGLLHRYRDRILLVTTNQCAVHCRHCMRKRNWNQSLSTPLDLKAILQYLEAHAQVREVIISGGDPLLLPTRQLQCLLQALHASPKVEIVRIGSRLPVVLPQRFSVAFANLLGRYGPTWLATHFNHPAELTPAAAQACRRLLAAGVPVVNQSVLLKGINDDVATLQALFTGLLRFGVKPYYLFHGDPVQSTSHFRTGIDAGLALMAALRGHVSGLALPTFAIDLPDGGGKVPLLPNWQCSGSADAELCFRSFDGRQIAYPRS